MSDGFRYNNSYPTWNCAMANTHHCPFISGVLEEVLGNEHLAEAGMLFPEKHFWSEMETVWCLFIMVWYLWISLEWISKLDFQNATLRTVGRALFELKTRVWNTSCVPLPGGGLSVEQAESAAWWAFFPQLQGNFSGKWQNIYVQTSNLSLFIG